MKHFINIILIAIAFAYTIPYAHGMIKPNWNIQKIDLHRVIVIHKHSKALFFDVEKIKPTTLIKC